MIGGMDLHDRADLGALADTDFDHVEDHATEIGKAARADADVAAVVTMERRADHQALAAVTAPPGAVITCAPAFRAPSVARDPDHRRGR